MKVLHICEGIKNGGADVSAWRLHEGLLRVGVESRLLVASLGRSTETASPNCECAFPGLQRYYRAVRARTDSLLVRARTGKNIKDWTYGSPKYGLNSHLKKLDPDIVNFHWVNGGFLGPKDLDLTYCPSVWTMHDMWGLTGGCHYSFGCDRYLEMCGNCPQLATKIEDDLSRQGWMRKMKAWKSASFEIVTPSQWLGECARKSSITKTHNVQIVPYGLDLSVFQPDDGEVTKNDLGIDPSSSVVLFGAMSVADSRKGGDLLRDSLSAVRNQLRDRKVTLVVFGSYDKMLENFDDGVPIISVGKLVGDLALAKLYAAASVFVAPSREDNLPNTVMEATACGVPTVAFDIGGMPDMIDDGATGRLIAPYNAGHMGKAIIDVLDNQRQMSRAARIKAEKEFPLILQAERYQRIYERMIR